MGHLRNRVPMARGNTGQHGAQLLFGDHIRDGVVRCCFDILADQYLQPTRPR